MDATEIVLIWEGDNLPEGCEFENIGDPAGNSRDTTKTSPAIYISRKAAEYGLTINIRNGIQTFKVRRESVAGRLTKVINGEAAILIDPSCTLLIDGFDGGYSYKEIGNSGVFHTEPQDNEYTHIHDSIQYPATILFAPQQDNYLNKPIIPGALSRVSTPWATAR
jgi:hypothetical protein